MRKQISTLVVLSALLACLWYLGGYAFMVGLGVIGLTTIIFCSFALGVKWSHKLMTEGARLAIESAGQNDQHDAIKIKALAQLTRDTIKAKYDCLPAPTGYPALPTINAVDGSFTIAGLEDTDSE